MKVPTVSAYSIKLCLTLQRVLHMKRFYYYLFKFMCFNNNGIIKTDRWLLINTYSRIYT